MTGSGEHEGGVSAHALMLARCYGSPMQAASELTKHGWPDCEREQWTKRELELEINYRSRVMAQLRLAGKLGVG